MRQPDVYKRQHKNNAFMVNLSDAVEKAAKDKGLEIKVYSADSDPAKQVSQIESAIAQGVDGLLIDPASFDGITTCLLYTSTPPRGAYRLFLLFSPPAVSVEQKSAWN